MSVHRLSNARPIPERIIRHLTLGVIAGLVAFSVACGGSATSTPQPTPDSTEEAAPTAAPSPTNSQTPDDAATPASTPANGLVLGGMVRVGSLDFPVETAVKADDRIRGLSGRASLDAGTGMLFIFEKAERLRFWMREMEIPLDMVWISEDCRVVDVSENVPFPDPETSLEDLPRYAPESPAKYVLEINGGEAADLGLGVGDEVEFLNAIAGRFDC